MLSSLPPASSACINLKLPSPRLLSSPPLLTIAGSLEHSWDNNGRGELGSWNTTVLLEAEAGLGKPRLRERGINVSKLPRGKAMWASGRLMSASSASPASTTASSSAADAILHIGDIAYAVGYAAEWDEFMSQVMKPADRYRCCSHHPPSSPIPHHLSLITHPHPCPTLVRAAPQKIVRSSLSLLSCSPIALSSPPLLASLRSSQSPRVCPGWCRTETTSAIALALCRRPPSSARGSLG